MKDLQREILSLVASGKITAAEGAARLESLGGGASPTVAELPAPPPAQSIPALTGVRQVKVMSQFGSAEVVGDASVAFAVAEGPHRARQEGDTMVIEHAPFGDGDDTFSFGHGGRRIVVNGTDFQRRRSLTVRMNPELALVATVQAGSVRIEGVHGPVTADVQAGNCKLRDFRGPLTVVAQAGNVTASGRLDSGASKIRCEMGSVQINLEKGSSVRITARSTFGKVGIEGENGPVVGHSGKDVTIGGGAATLDVECTMGNVKVTAE
jgi:hypothetical protein